MKTYTVESANKERNRYLRWLALVWPVVYLPLIIIPYVGSDYIWPLLGVTLASCGFLFFAIFRLMYLNRTLKGFPSVVRALREEIFFVYQRKALTVGFYSVMGLLAVLAPVSRVVPIRTDTVCMSLFFIGILTYLLSWLLYNRE